MKVAVSNYEYANMFQSNLNKASYQASIAAKRGCELIVFHEWFLGINPIGTIPNKVTNELSKIARKNGIMLISGGIRYVDMDGGIRVGSFVFDKTGQIISIQSKVHLYENEKKWIKPGFEVNVINTCLGNVLIVAGFDGMNVDYLSDTINKVNDTIDLIVFQCTEFNEEGKRKIRQIAIDSSRQLKCTAVIAGLHGFFYESNFIGESVVIESGEVKYEEQEKDEVVIGFQDEKEQPIEYPVVDCHVHIVFREPGEVAVDDKVQRLVEKSVDVPVKTAIISYMNRAKIDRSVIFDWSGALKKDYFLTNSKVADLSRYSDRFIGFGVPSCSESEYVGEMVKLGLKGLKFNPSLQGFYVNDEKFLEVCREADKYHLPVLIHTGPESAGKLRYDMPLYIDDIAVEYPNLNIIIAHIGVRGFTSEQAIMVAEKNANVYVETSWASKALVKEAITKLGADKVIFGSDFPSGNPINELAKIKELLDTKFINETEYHKITGGNILKLIGE